MSRRSRAVGKATASYGKAQADAAFADPNATEEAKIKAMMYQSACVSGYLQYYDEIHVPKWYECRICLVKGHHRVSSCPNKAKLKQMRVRKAHGIPKSMMMKVEGPDVLGAMATENGEYGVPILNAEAYIAGKKEAPPFVSQPVQKGQDRESQKRKRLPEFVICPICKELMRECVLVPCCGDSGCSDCVYEAIIDAEDHKCPFCKKQDQKIDQIVINRNMRVLCSRYQ